MIPTPAAFRLRSPFRNGRDLAFLLTFLAAGACVTVNVNFPESAVQKATDDYVKDLYRAKEKGRSPSPGLANDPAAPTNPPANEPDPTSQPPTKKKASSKGNHSHNQIPAAFSLLNPAWAEPSTDIKVNSDKALAIRGRLAGRLDEVLAKKRQGILGESNDGMLVLKAPEKLKLNLKTVEKLVKDENADRTELYADVARSNGIDKNVKDVQKSFARSFQAESPSGTWVQDADGKWSQKP